MAAINYTVEDDWGSGFVANIKVPGGAQGLQGWTLEFDAAFEIGNIWGAEIVSHVGNHYVIRNVSWNASVPVNGEASFGFQAKVAPGSTGTEGTAVTGFILNGVADTTTSPAPVLPTLAIGDASIIEGDSSAAQLTFTVTLSQAASEPVTVGYATANGTAVAGADYMAASGTITFAAGETTRTISIPIVGDTTLEANESFTVTLSGASGATIADGSATATIVNNDSAPPPATDGTSVEYDVTSNWGSGFTASMTVGAGSGGLSGWTIEFDAGFTITSIWNAVIVSHVGTHYVVRNASWNGSVGSGKETSFGFQATPGSGGTQASGFTVNGVPVGSDPAPVVPTLSVADATVTEGDSGMRELVFTVTLSAAATSAVTVAYATANGTATGGSDYTALGGTLTFAAGEISKIVRVPVAGDTVVEDNETLTLTLSSPTGATIADGTAVGTIANDDVAPLPSLAISDASVAEGNPDAPGIVTFTVTLSAASTSAVTVSFATADGTAVAGSDYVARSGTLTFAPGETQKTLAVNAIGDAVVEPNESFSVVLTSPVGATLADAAGSGTIINDDAAAPVLPTLGISDASVIEGDPGTNDGGGSDGGSGGADGWFSTSGNQIVDSTGSAVQIAGVNWFGFESTNLAPHGLWTRSYKEMMDQMLELGFNTIRLPFSNDTLHSTASPNGIDFSKNPDLQGLSALQIMDKIVDYAGEIGLRIILDHHRNDSGAGASSNGLWYDSQHSQADWIDDWQMLAARYADDPTVIGADLHNEPYAGTWGGGGANDWAAAAELAGNAIGAVNPNWLIFVEGVASYQGENYWWGGNLMGVRDRPIELDVTNKLVYSAHDYPNSVWQQPWFQGSDFPENLAAKFDQMWGYIYKEGIAPVFIGEFGTKLADPKDAPWFEAITAYLAGDFDNDGTSDIPAGQQGISWTYWSWNPNSGDTGGILADDWLSVHDSKLAYLEPIQFDFASDGADGADDNGTGTQATFTLTLSSPATEPVTVHYHTEPGTADSTDFVTQSGTVTFAAGEQTKTITIAITPDDIDEADETFSVVLTDATGATLGRATGIATIVDDDDAATPPPPAPSGDLEAAFSLVDSWNSGFNGSVLVHNEGDATSAWQIVIEMPYQITDIWNAEILSHDGNVYVIGPAAWNGTIAHDGETSFGFVASGQYSAGTIQIDGLGDNDVPDSVPTVPTGLAATTISSTSALLSWNASTVPGGGLVTGYAIFVDGEQVATTSGTNYRVTGLSPDTDYQFAITAIDAAGSSELSPALAVHTTDPLPSADDGHIFSPYIDMAMATAADLAGLSETSGIENFTLAFVLSSSEGIGWQGWGSIENDTLSNGSTILDQVQAIQANGGHITISFGGAAGEEAALNATDAGQLQALYQSVIDRYQIDSIDFDIEGGAIRDYDSIALRNDAIAGLQAANPDLKVSFTLPVLPTGLTQDGLSLLQSAMEDGVQIDLVNIMAMDYGTAVDNNGQMGLNAILASEATQQQMAAIGLDAKLGITPMIGVNDIVSEVFTLADAQALVDYAANDPDVAMLSMWSVARDNGSTAGASYASPTGSGLEQDPFAFASIFQQYDIL